MIRWIVNETLGTAPYSDDLRAIATVVDVRELADREGNDPAAIRLKVEEGIAALNAGSKVIVACDFGISRSNAIAAGILAKWKGQSLDWAVKETVSRTNEASIKLDMINAIRLAMFEESLVADPGSVFITGATGFLGRHCREYLSDRMEVFAPGREELDLMGDATELERFARDRRIGQLLHLAHPRVYTSNAALGQSLTILKNLMDVCRVLGIRLILPSGGVVFSGYRSAGRSVKPDTVPRPKGIYGETKYLQEMLVQTAVANDEIEATIVRIAPTYGPGADRPRLIRFFYQSLLDDKPIVTHLYNDATPARLDLLYVDDAVSGLAKVLVNRKSRIHHLAPGEPYSPREIAAHIASLLGKAPEFKEMPISDYASNIFLDATASRRSLGWSPVVHLAKGLSQTIASFV